MPDRRSRGPICIVISPKAQCNNVCPSLGLQDPATSCIRSLISPKHCSSLAELAMRDASPCVLNAHSCPPTEISAHHRLQSHEHVLRVLVHGLPFHASIALAGQG